MREYESLVVTAIKKHLEQEAYREKRWRVYIIILLSLILLAFSFFSYNFYAWRMTLNDNKARWEKAMEDYSIDSTDTGKTK